MSGIFAGVAFENSLALWALLSLPAIWWLMRAVPPRPVVRAFPPLRILMSLQQKQETADRMPWWLLLLRLIVAALMIFAVSHPYLRKSHILAASNGPLLIVMDDGWAAARDWPQRQDALLNLVNEADGRIIFLAGTSKPALPSGESPEDAAKRLRAWVPQALSSSRDKALSELQELKPAPSEIIWLTDGLDAGTGKSFASGLAAVAPLQTFDLPAHRPPLAIGKPTLAGGDIAVDVLHAAAAPDSATVQVMAGDGRILSEAPVTFSGADHMQAKVSLPVELRNAIQSIDIKDEDHAGAKSLLDDTWRRKTVAFMSGTIDSSDQPLLTSSHYIESAMGPVAELSTPQNSAELKSALDAGLSMLVLSDIGTLSPEDHDAIAIWLDKGGLLLRFAGPRLASNTDDLLPVKLREGDRNLGSALSWETPQTIKPFADTGPLAGIAIDSHATVSRQVLAEPDADLAAKTWASLQDGTPLITADHHGAGRIVLFHVTANADWSNLPLTGTFAQILQRLTDLAPAAGNPQALTQPNNSEGDFAPHLLMTGTGELVTPTENIKGLPLQELANASATLQTPAGFYARGDQIRAINLKLEPKDLAALAPEAGVKPLQQGATTAYAPALFGLVAFLFLLDCLVTLFLAGLLRARPEPALVIALALLCLTPHPRADAATSDQQALDAALQTRLAYIKTGDAEIDQESEQGLKGLSNFVNDRTSAVLSDPRAVDIENDEIVFYPLLYWPVTAAAATPDAQAMQRISDYVKNGGTILFDLRDNTAELGSGPIGAALRRIISQLDVPPLEPVPEDHALTKSFYLLNDFPGRYEGAPVWVESSDAVQSAGFDSVSGVIIGANDYAAAWASDRDGQPLYAMIPGEPRQRELAYRFGVNLVMYVLTGNYKTDQVHVPAILERLGKP